MADEKDKKPSLAVVIAAAKDKGKKPSPMEGDGEPDADGDYDDDAGSVPPEAVQCMPKFNEAAADGDDEGQAKALKTFLIHLGVISE